MLSEEKKGTRYLCVETEGWDTLNFTYTTGSTPKEAWLKTVSKEDLEDEPDKKKAKVKKIKMLDGEAPDAQRKGDVFFVRWMMNNATERERDLVSFAWGYQHAYFSKVERDIMHQTITEDDNSQIERIEQIAQRLGFPQLMDLEHMSKMSPQECLGEDAVEIMECPGPAKKVRKGDDCGNNS